MYIQNAIGRNRTDYQGIEPRWEAIPVPDQPSITQAAILPLCHVTVANRL